MRAAIRRSLAVIVFCVLLGGFALNVIEQLQGPVYSAEAQVLISTSPLSRIITGTESAFVDPQRVEDTARALAGSRALYERTAERTRGRLGSAADLESATTASGGRENDVLVFATKGSDRRRAIFMANAVASSYIAWRAELSGSSIRTAIDRIRTRLPSLSSEDPARADLQSQLKRLELLLTLNSGDAVLAQAAKRAEKTSPAPVRDTLLGAALGLVVGLLVAAGREAIDTKVRSEGDVESVLAAPVLAALPTLPRKARMVTYGRHQRRFGDIYGLLAANIAQQRDGPVPRVIAVTSAIAREGKSTTAANLAVALARRGVDVCVADFDFRKPMLDQFFGLPPDAAGAVQILSGNGALRGAVWRVELNDRTPKVSIGAPTGAREGSESAERGDRRLGSLHVLPAGGTARMGTITGSSRLVELLGRLRSRYRFVILDTPPALLTAEVTELGSAIDGVIVVVRQGWVSQRSLSSLRRQAQNWPAELVGAVLTDTRLQATYGDHYEAG